jgi:hypothetical protein
MELKNLAPCYILEASYWLPPPGRFLFDAILRLCDGYLANEHSVLYTNYLQQIIVYCFRFLATGNSFKSLAFSYRLGDSTTRKIIYSTCKVIWKHLQPIVMPVSNEEMWIQLEKYFNQRCNFPNLIGDIDGKTCGNSSTCK